MSYCIAHSLLQIALRFESSIFYFDIHELMLWTNIGNYIYSLDQIAYYYDDTSSHEMVSFIKKQKQCYLINFFQLQIIESVKSSIKGYNENKTLKQRESLSVFDEVLEPKKLIMVLSVFFS